MTTEGPCIFCQGTGRIDGELCVICAGTGIVIEIIRSEEDDETPVDVEHI